MTAFVLFLRKPLSATRHKRIKKLLKRKIENNVSIYFLWLREMADHYYHLGKGLRIQLFRAFCLSDGELTTQGMTLLFDVAHFGANPVSLLQRHPSRFSEGAAKIQEIIVNHVDVKVDAASEFPVGIQH